MPDRNSSGDESSIVTSITTPNGERKTLEFPQSSSSGLIVQESTAAIGAHLEPAYYEVITENIERSRGLINGGLKISFKLPDALGGFSFDFERSPKKETRSVKKTIYKRKKE